MATLSSNALAIVLAGLLGQPACRVAPEPAPVPAPAAPAGPDDDARGSDGSGGGSRSRGATGGAASGGTRTSGASTGGSEAASDAAGGGASSRAAGGSSATASTGGTRAATGGAADEGEGESAAGAPGGAEQPAGTGRPGASAACTGQAVAFDEIQSGAVRSSVVVHVDAVATSQKFLLSHAKSGGCLFGAFVGAAPGREGPRGLLVVSYGDDAPSGAACATGTDALPDDLAPGDALGADGYLDAYAPSGCGGTPSPQLRVEAACPVVRSGHGDVPEPWTLSLEEADAIARGADAALGRRFAGGLVRLEGVTARRADDGSGVVGPYGVVKLAETALEVHNDLEYGDLSLAGPGDAAKSLVLPYPTTFTSLTGLVYLDYCTWSLTPRSRCTDLAPPSENCP